MHFFSTYDMEWGRRAYPFVKKTAEFWEDDLVYENGQYHVVDDAAHEEVSSTGERDNIHALGMVTALFRGILKMSRLLQVDCEMHEKWEDIAAHMPPFPKMVRNGQTVFSYGDYGYNWRDANGTPVQFIYPAGCIGLDSDAETLEIARNTLEQKDYLFFQSNAYCEYIQQRTRVGCDPKKAYRKMVEGCKKLSWDNRYMTAHGGAIEDFSAIPAGINEMMLQSHEGVIRVFPCWPKGKDARFFNLRAYGAFLVSSEMQNNEVGFAEIVSEKGTELTVQNPWASAVILKNGKEYSRTENERICISTEPDDTICLKKQEG